MRQKVYENAIEFFLRRLSTERLAWGITLSVIRMSNEAPLEEANFSFASRCRLQIVNWGAHVHYPLSALGLVCLASVQALYMLPQSL